MNHPKEVELLESALKKMFPPSRHQCVGGTNHGPRTCFYENVIAHNAQFFYLYDGTQG